MIRAFAWCDRNAGWIAVAMCAALALGILAGCGGAAAAGRADGAHDDAAAAAIAAAEARARLAEGRGSLADALTTQARADALTAVATAEDQRQAKLRAEDRAASVAADRDRLGWWATAAGMALLVLASGVSALGWYYGLGKLSQGVGAACAASGGAALALGLSWGWLPILAAVVILGGALVLLLCRASRAISTHAERMHGVPPDDPGTGAKARSAAEQAGAGVWTAVQRLRGKPADPDRLRWLLAGAVGKSS